MDNEQRRKCILTIAGKAAKLHISKCHYPDKYAVITEGRNDWTSPSGERKIYSWCGDFVTWVLMTAGLSDGSVLNRAALNNGVWQPGYNITRLLFWARDHDALYQKDFRQFLKPGDPVVINRPRGGHICIFKTWTDKKKGMFISVDGNAAAGATSFNNRMLKGGGHSPVFAAVNADALPWDNCSTNETAFGNPIALRMSELSNEEIAEGGDGIPPEPAYQ
jgi:hypothetical protein